MRALLKRERSEEEKVRRHLYGDRGAKYQSKEFIIDCGDFCCTLTSVFSKDNLIMEIWTL